MEIVSNNYMPGDPRLIQQIVYELKSQGIFDHFRKECIADVDTKPAYQNLRQRVEGSVTTFLNQQTWSPDMNKNQIREQLRKNIHDSGFLDSGVERIVEQVVNPKINSVFLPKVEDVVYRYLGIEKPQRDNPHKTSNVDIKDLLPTDLEAVSPESNHGGNKCASFEESMIKMDESSTLDNSSNKCDEDESPPFEALESNANDTANNENSVDSHMSVFSGLRSNDDSNQGSDNNKVCQMDISSADSQTSQNSSESHVSVVNSDETKMEISEDSQTTMVKPEIYNEDPDVSNGTPMDVSPDCGVAVKEDGKNIVEAEKSISEDDVVLEQTEQRVSNNNHEEKSDELKSESKPDGIKNENQSDEIKSESRSDEIKCESKSDSKDEMKSRHSDYSGSRDRSDDRHSKSSRHRNKSKHSSSSSKEKEASSSSSSSSNKDRDREGSTSSKSKEYNSSSKDKSRSRDKRDSSKTSGKDNDRNRDRNAKEKDRSKQDKERNSKDKSDKNKSDKEKSKDKSDREKTERSQKENIDKDKNDKHNKDKSLKSDKECSDKDKSEKSKQKSDRDKSEPDKSIKEKTEQKEKDKMKGSSSSAKHSSSSKDRSSSTSRKDKSISGDGKDKSKTSSSDSKLNRSDSKSSVGGARASINTDNRKDSRSKHKKDEKPSRSSSSNSSKHSKDKKKDKQTKDDHYSSKDKNNERRSTDRDSNDGNSSRHSNNQSSSSSLNEKKSSSTTQNTRVVDSSSSSGNGDSSGNSDQTDSVVTVVVEAPLVLNSETQPLKYIKPKFASNFKEAIRIMKIRKQIAKLERQNQLSLSEIKINSNSQQNGIDDSKEEEELKEPIDQKEEKKSPVIVKTTNLSKESWDALEARLAQEMANVDHNSYGNFDESDNSDTEKAIEEVQVETNNECNSESKGDNGMEVMSLLTSSSESPCRYLEKQSPSLEHNLQFLQAFIAKLEKDVTRYQEISLNNFTISTAPAAATCRKRKRDQFVVDVKNNNKTGFEQTAEVKNSTTLRPPNSAISKAIKDKTNQCTTDVIANECFPLPLSPESDISTDKKEEETATPKLEKKKRISKSVVAQRYSSEDLYKPRPTITGTRRTRTAKNCQ